LISDKDIDDYIEGDVSAIVRREYLIPVEGKQSPFFPPTFVGTGQGDSSYCIDTMKDGTRVCLVDTVGSQANRMEPIFVTSPYNALIPQVTIETPYKQKNLCEVGHRIADALLRHSSIIDDIESALDAIKNNKDSSMLAKIAPTSLVFGMWDSRKTQVKLPRIVSSVIRAYDIDVLSRSAQYFPPVDYREEKMLGEIKDKKEKETRSKLGYNEIPATNTHGGIIARDSIQRDIVINLTALRKIRSSDESKTKTLQKYILGLALVSASAIQEWDLRQGCLLTVDPEKDKPKWEVVYPDGTRKDVIMSHKDVLTYAYSAAEKFGIGNNRKATFDVTKAKHEIDNEKKKKE